MGGCTQPLWGQAGPTLGSIEWLSDPHGLSQEPLSSESIPAVLGVGEQGGGPRLQLRYPFMTPEGEDRLKADIFKEALAEEITRHLEMLPPF